MQIDTDDGLRSALHGLAQDWEADASLLDRVRTRARRRTQRRRAAVAAMTAVAGLAAAVAISESTDQRAPEVAADLGESEDGFGPFDPLVDAPLADVASTPVVTTDEAVMSASVSGGQLTLSLRYVGTEENVAIGAYDPTEPYQWLGFHLRPPRNDLPVPLSYIGGATRAEIARVENVERDDGSVSVDTVSHPSFPGLRFYLFPTMALSIESSAVPPSWMNAYSASGDLLIDGAKPRMSGAEFEAAYDRYRGVVPRAAHITGARLSDDDTTLTLSATTCGLRSTQRWEEGAREIRIDVIVKRPPDDGDCTEGPTATIDLLLNEPLGERTVVDNATGEVVEVKLP